MQELFFQPKRKRCRAERDNIILSCWVMTSCWHNGVLSYIQNDISSHSGQLSLKKYHRKTSLNACSSRFSPSGTWASSTTSMGLGSTPTPSSWSSAMTWGLAVGSRSLASIILTQWSSEHCSFSAFYKGRMMISSKTALRGGTTGILTKPILMTSYTIYLSISIEKTVTRGDFQFDPFCE